jgi:hypothetical protein
MYTKVIIINPTMINSLIQIVTKIAFKINVNKIEIIIKS